MKPSFRVYEQHWIVKAFRFLPPEEADLQSPRHRPHRGSAVKVLIHGLVVGLLPKVSTTTSNLVIGVTALAGISVYLAAGFICSGWAARVILGIVVGDFLGDAVT